MNRSVSTFFEVKLTEAKELLVSFNLIDNLED
ncbi:hypothetical protein SAMN05428977_102647 [Nitrosomonas sp. Nm166]|nr:hypothetical protein SAMN05428977_102647 [Nitrosomonas sp. Nm166]